MRKMPIMRRRVCNLRSDDCNFSVWGDGFRLASARGWGAKAPLRRLFRCDGFRAVCKCTRVTKSDRRVCPDVQRVSEYYRSSPKQGRKTIKRIILLTLLLILGNATLVLRSQLRYLVLPPRDKLQDSFSHCRAKGDGNTDFVPGVWLLAPGVRRGVLGFCISFCLTSQTFA